MNDDPGADLETEIRRARRRMGAFVVGLVLVSGLVGLAALTFRDRRVYLIGGTEPVAADVEGMERLRIVAPYSFETTASPGSHPVTALSGPAIGSVEVPWAPWTNQVVAPVQADQCLIVASADGLYGDAVIEGDTVHVHAFTTSAESLALPPLFSDVVATHPCHLPPEIRLLDTIVMVATVPCAAAPSTEREARAVVLAQLASCGVGDGPSSETVEEAAPDDGPPEAR